MLGGGGAYSTGGAHCYFIYSMLKILELLLYSICLC